MEDADRPLTRKELDELIDRRLEIATKAIGCAAGMLVVAILGELDSANDILQTVSRVDFVIGMLTGKFQSAFAKEFRSALNLYTTPIGSYEEPKSGDALPE